MKPIAFLSLLAGLSAANAAPDTALLNSWFLAGQGENAQIYNGVSGGTVSGPLATWTNGTQTQSSAVLGDVQEVRYSTSGNYVYVNVPDLASYVMGPWWNNIGKTAPFINLPINQSGLFRIAYNSTYPSTTHGTAGNGPVGLLVNGVAIFNAGDAFAYSHSVGADANPGDGIWNRLAEALEAVTFDHALAHQPGNGQYHNHVNPTALRAQLGDNIDYVGTTNYFPYDPAVYLTHGQGADGTYVEHTANFRHSPIIGWSFDGYPVYGPYSYSTATDPTSIVRRMQSSYSLRTDLTTGSARISVPGWSAVLDTAKLDSAGTAATALYTMTTAEQASYAGPIVSTAYPLGRYGEDYAYVAGSGDLDQYNGRYCKTPDYPNGTYAYFVTIDSTGAPVFPYIVNRQYYGTNNGSGSVSSITETVTISFNVATNTAPVVSGPSTATVANGSTLSLSGSSLITVSDVDAAAMESVTLTVSAGTLNVTLIGGLASGAVISAGANGSSTITLSGGVSQLNAALATLTYTAPASSASATLSVQANDGSTTNNLSNTLTTTITFNTPPTITSITNVSTMKNNTTTAIAFTVGDAQIPAGSLTLSASSSNTTLAPLANIFFGGSDASRTVTVTPATGQVGTATITITVSDGTSTASTTFSITVKPPNILLIIADDYGLDASSIYNTASGVSLPPTPNIASLATNGLAFTHAYTYCDCSPSRSAILTGRYAYRTGTGNVVGGAASNNALKAFEFTLPDAFAANSSFGYQLMHIGKWHLGGTNTTPCTIGGWPSFSGTLGAQLDSYYSWPKVVSTATTSTTATSTTYATTDQVNDAVSFITAHNPKTGGDGKPFFAWVAFNAPHVTTNSPFYQLPPTSLCPAYASLSGTTADILANPLQYYLALVQAMDTEIGRLLQSVDLTTTDIIFVGDNGTPNAVLQAPYPTNHGKQTLYEGGIRVPLIISGPDVVSPGRTTDVLTHFVDLYSTILELAGINVAGTVPSTTVLDSQSLVPVLSNPSQSVFRTQTFDDYFDLGFPTLSGSGRILRDAQYKVIRYNFGLAADKFYDLVSDPYETNNLLSNGVSAMTTAQQTAYNNLVSQLGSYNTPPTISTIANQSTPMNTATSAIPFTIGDPQEVATNLGLTTSSSNTTVVPAANIVVAGTAPNHTVTVTPATGQIGTTNITLTVSDGTFTTSSTFPLTVGAVTTVSNITTSPTTPTNTDNVTVTAAVTPLVPSGGVQLTYNTGAQVTAPAFQEAFANASTASGITGAMNAWTATANRAPADVRLRSGTGNHTAPIVLTNCTTNGTTTVTCTSTTGLIAGMSISGTNIAAGTTISSITNSTTFVTSAAATGSGAGLSITAAGVTLTGCSLTNSTTIGCASTTGLSVGMGISGTGLVTNPPNMVPIVATISVTSFTVTVGNSGTVTTCPTTLTASGCGLELSTGTANYTDTMATTTSAINASGATSGYVEFYARTAALVSNNGWTFQIFDGTNWNTRLSESYSSGTLANCILNSGNNQTSGSTTIGCSNTTGLAVGMTLQGAATQVAGCTTNPNSAVVLTTNTSGLAIGMFVTGPPNAGISPNVARIISISPGASFTLGANATPTSQQTGLILTANFLAPNTTISAITPNVFFTVNNAAFYSGTASLVNHGFMLNHYNLVAGDMTANMKMRFQWSGATATAPAQAPTCDIDDITVMLTTGAAPVTVTMYDDGLHGDGAANDGVYGTSIPAQAAGATVSYTITATDSSAGTAAGSGSYTVQTAAPVLTVTPATALSSAGAAGSGIFSPASLAYTLTNSGTGTMSWTAGNTQSWLNLSATSGTLAAGANATVTASINVTNANSLTANTYSDTITFTNSTNGSGNTTRSASLLVTNGVPTVPAAPVIATLPLFSAGTSKTILWPAVATATSYTLQIASSANFTTNLLSSQTVTTPYATFMNLSDGVTYYYRVLATNSIGSSAYSNTVYSTQDTGAPSVAIVSPTRGTSTATNTITVTGTASDTRSGISGVKVNNVAATSTSGSTFATWSATVPLGFGTNVITATATDGAGNQATTFATSLISPVTVTMTTPQTYNPLIIPDSITGTTFNLDLYQINKQFPTWSATNPTLGINPSTTLGAAPGTTTLGYNGALMWGPTLIMNQGDTVQLNVANHLDQSSSTLLRSTTTTVHWHGFHIPAIMDGGPRQVIAAGTTWSPTFTVKNSAATYWYHPHLHMATQEQLTLGAGGFIIVRDPVEAALNLPRTYGVDDIPLAVTTRRLLSGNNEFSANQYVQSDSSTSSTDNYGDYVLVNGTMNPQVSLPQQYVRLHILSADIQRGYRIGFSDNRNFFVIGNDQGLLNAPQLVSQVTMMIGERVEILVNLGSDAIGSSIDLMAYDNLGTAGALSGSLGGFGGSESNSRAPNGNSGPENGGLLCNSNFNVLHINVAAPTANAVNSVPATLANNTYWTDGQQTNTRVINIANGNGGTPGFTFDGIAYSPTFNNYTIPLNAIEEWRIDGGQVFGHSLHIHDIKFKIVARGTTNTAAGNGVITGNTNQIFDTVNNNGGVLIGSKACANYESGWKDTVYVPRGETVWVIAQYNDFASPNNPYMVHCHMLNHEDGGLMGQFLVTDAATETIAAAAAIRTGSNNTVSFQFNATTGTSYLVQYSPDLTTGSWVNVGEATSDGTAATYTETNATRLAQSRGFYRAVIQSVVAPPVITSGTAANATRGTAFSYQITATNNPAGYSAILLTAPGSGLPGGLSVNPKTGLISGIIPTTTAAGTYNINVSASNSGGTNHAMVVLTVN